METEAGRAFVVEEVYPLSHRHGDLPLAAFLEQPPGRWLCRLASAAPLSPDDWVFFDIETTGLFPEAGIYAFLVGLGRFVGETFTLRQVFMRSPAEERALLLTVADLLRETAGLISFNGRAFDLPLLQTRYALARLPLPWQEQVHLDLLPPARRLWRERVPSCRLADLEEHLLGVARDSLDLPGWRVPSLYHEYLRGAEGSCLRPIFYHNAQDILSLVTLSVRLERVLQDPGGEARHGLDLYALARIYEQQGDLEDAIAACRAALLRAMPLPLRERVWKHLSLLLKRAGRWEEAVEIWRSLIGRAGEHPLYAYVELAKYYEHRCRDLEQAEAVTRRAIAEYGTTLAGEGLAHRLTRLLCKIDRALPEQAPEED